MIKSADFRSIKRKIPLYVFVFDAIEIFKIFINARYGKNFEILNQSVFVM